MPLILGALLITNTYLIPPPPSIQEVAASSTLLSLGEQFYTDLGLSTSTSALITQDSALYGVSGRDMARTIQCESGGNPGAVGDQGTSYGLAQIHLIAHADVTKGEALDPEFAVRWMARQFALGNQSIWTCARMLDIKAATST